MFFKRWIIIIIIVSPLLFSEMLGGYAYDFYDYGINARIAGMGNAGRTIAKDSSACFWNSSLLTEANPYNLTYANTKLLEDSNYTFAGINMPMWGGVLGFNIAMLMTDGIEKHIKSSTPALTPDGYFVAGNKLFILSYATRLNADLAIGVSNKLETRDLDGATDKVYTVDIGTLYKLGAIRLGSNIRNICVYKDSTTADEYKPDIDLGVSLQPFTPLLVAFDYTRILSAKQRSYFGVEYTFYLLKMRAGINDNEQTLGLGLDTGFMGIDYAYVVQSLENQHRFSVNFDCFNADFPKPKPSE